MELPKELTANELNKIAASYGWPCENLTLLNTLRAAIAADRAKQSEPERVKFRAARNAGHNDITMFKTDADVASVGYEWLEPEQSFEVVLS